MKVHVDETEEKAYEVGRKYLDGPGNIFLEGSRGVVSPVLQNLPGLTDRKNLLPTAEVRAVAASRGRAVPSEARAGGSGTAAGIQPATGAPYDEQLEHYTIITGTPKSVLPKIRHVLEYLRPGSIFFWDGDGAMTHEDTMRSLRLFGEEVIPAVREMSKELDLPGPYEVDPATNQPVAAAQPVAGDQG